jgi:RHS repeat-associated protein
MYLSEDRIGKGLFPYEPRLQCGMIHNDHLATPQKLTDSSGVVVWSADYKPFGEATVTVSTITNNLRFPGQYYDAETGLNYNYYRDNNPIIGRYIESDPIGIKGGINLYSYTANNPINRKDPMGLDSGSATSQLLGEIPGEILGMMVDQTIGGITGAACASRYCKNRSTPSSWGDAYSTCMSIFAAHPEIPTGIPPTTTSDGFVAACADGCMSITGKASFKTFCKICPK